MSEIFGIIKKVKSKLMTNNGSTMIEVLVSFIVLSIILLIISRIVIYCYGLRMKSMDTETVTQKFNEECYKDSDKVDINEVEIKNYSTKTEDGPVFYLELDYSNTEMMNNNVKDNSTDYTKYKIRMNNLEATCYSSNNPLIEEENLVQPKALFFKTKE